MYLGVRRKSELTRNVPSALFTNSEMSSRYFVQIQKCPVGTLLQIQKCPVGTLYKSRSVPSVFFTNLEMLRRYFVQIQKYPIGTLYKFRNVPSVLCTNKNNSNHGTEIKDVQNKINILRLCSYLNSLEWPSDCVKN